MSSPVINYEHRPPSPSSSDVQCRFQDHKTHQQEATLLTFSDGGEQDSLACDEDESSLELHEPAEREPNRGPAVRLSAACDIPAPAAFDAPEARDTIRNELSRLQKIHYVPESAEARRFADGNRPRAVSWLVQVVTALDLSKETLHSAVSLLDRFIAGTEAHPPEPVLQLLALGCLSAAAKHEEVAQRSSDEWIGLAVDGDRRMLYERLDLHRMEWLLLETVEWRIRVPNTYTFLRQYHAVLVNHGSVRDDPAFLASFKACAELLAEVSMLYAEFLSFGYSTIAVSCLTLADWYCQSVFGPPSPGPSPSAGLATPASELPPAPAKDLVSTLAAFLGLDAPCIAPGLGRCLDVMAHLYRLVLGPVGHPWGGGLPGAAELGLLAPVVARYRHVSPQACK